MDNQTTGLFMMCGICLVPFIVGLLVGLWVQKRITLYGFPGALLPRMIRDALERAARSN